MPGAEIWAELAPGTSGARLISRCTGKDLTTATVVPTSAREARCKTAGLSMRKQPDDCAWPTMGFHIVGAMDAVEPVPQIDGHHPKRIAEAACHLLGQGGISFAHFRWRMPIGPDLLATYRFRPGPIEAVLAN